MQLIDTKKTCTNVINLLKDYQSLLHIAQRQNPAYLASPVINGIPSSKTYKNRSEDKMIIYTNATLIIKSINDTLNKMDKMQADILRDLYIRTIPLTQLQLEQKYFLSHATIYKYKNDGLLNFAKLYDLEDLNYYQMHSYQ